MKSIRSMNTLDSKPGSELGSCVLAALFATAGIAALPAHATVLT